MPKATQSCLKQCRQCGQSLGTLIATMSSTRLIIGNLEGWRWIFAMSQCSPLPPCDIIRISDNNYKPLVLFINVAGFAKITHTYVIAQELKSSF